MMQVFLMSAGRVSPINQLNIMFGDKVIVVNSEIRTAGKVMPGVVAFFDEYDENKIRLLKRYFVNVMVFSDGPLEKSVEVSRFLLDAPINPRCFYQFYTKMQKWGCDLNYGIAICNGKLIIQKLFGYESPDWETEMETVLKKSGYGYELKRNFLVSNSQI